MSIDFSDPLDILLDRSLETEVRLQVLLQLAEDFDPAWLTPLDALAHDTSETPEIRSAVALVLGKLADRGYDEATFGILATLVAEPDATVRNYVMQALGMTHTEAAAPLLIEALKDPNNTIFASASTALGELGEKALPYLVELLSTGAEDARAIAAWQLGELGSEKAIPGLVSAMRREKSVSVLALCIWALGEIGFGSDEVIDLLTKARQEEEPEVRLRAETALKKIVRFRN